MDKVNINALNRQPIGVFDTGLGGLCSVKEMMKILPYEDIIYFGDTARVPYGNRSRETIIKYSKQDVRFLLSHDIKAIVIACGTVSSGAIEELRMEFPDKIIIGVVEGSCESAVKITKKKKKKTILALATAATISTDIYKKTIQKTETDIEVLNKACPLFVPLVENGYTGKRNNVTKLIAEDYLNEFKNLDLGAVILGCTHYPMIKDVIGDIFPEAELVDSGYEAAKKIFYALAESGLENDSETKGKLSVFVSDNEYNFAKIASEFLGSDIMENVTKIDIENY